MSKNTKEDNFDGGDINIGPENFPIKLQFKIFQNKKYLDIRKWYLDRKKSEVLPTKKGISLSDYQFNEILEILEKNKLDIKKWYLDKSQFEEFKTKLTKQAEVLRKISEDARKYKLNSKKISKNKFFEISYNDKGEMELIFNEKHSFFSQYNKLEKKEKKLVENILISFGQSMEIFDNEDKVVVSDLQEILIQNWANILNNYVKENK